MESSHTIYDLPECVKAGANLLDSEQPSWHNKIDLNYLDLYNSQKCILTQLFGNYTEGLQYLDLDNETDERFLYGFTLHTRFTDNDLNWVILNELWVAEINKRKESTLCLKWDLPAKQNAELQEAETY